MRLKRKIEAIVSLISVIVVAAVVAVYLWLIVEGRSPPQMLMWVAILGIVGALSAIYKVEDIKEVLSLLPIKFEK